MAHAAKNTKDVTNGSCLKSCCSHARRQCPLTMRNMDISCINKDNLEVYTDYKQINGQKMIPLHYMYLTYLNWVNNPKKVFFEILHFFCKSHDFFLLALTFFDLQGLAGLRMA